MRYFSLTIIILISFVDLQSQTRGKSFWVEQGLVNSNKEILSTFWNMVVYQPDGDRVTMKMVHADKLVLTHQIQFKSKELEIYHGSYKEWYDNGKLWVEGNYKNGKRVGKWSYYNFPEGYLEYNYVYRNGLKSGWHEQFDSLGNTIYRAHYVNDQIDGRTILFNSIGDTLEICLYEYATSEICDIRDSIHLRQIQVVQERPYISTAKCKVVDELEIQKCRSKKLYKEIYRRISYPIEDREKGITGKVVMYFNIEPDGTISDIQFKRSLSNSFEEVCREILNKLPPWIPGKENGVPIRVAYELPLSFRFTAS